MTTLAGIPQATVPAAAARALGVYGTSTGTTAWGWSATTAGVEAHPCAPMSKARTSKAPTVRPGTSLGMSHTAIRLFDVPNHPARRPPGTS